MPKLAVFAAVTVIVLGGLAWAAWTFFVVEEPPPPVVRKAAAPSSVATSPASATNDALTKANAATAATNEVIAAADAPTASVPSAGVVNTAQGGAPLAPVTVAAVDIPVAPVGPPPASPAFKAWVDALRVSGVRAGANPRVFIERTTYGVGDVVEPQMGVTFEGYDPETRMLRFKDRTGAIVERRH